MGVRGENIQEKSEPNEPWPQRAQLNNGLIPALHGGTWQSPSSSFNTRLENWGQHIGEGYTGLHDRIKAQIIFKGQRVETAITKTKFTRNKCEAQHLGFKKCINIEGGGNLV